MAGDDDGLSNYFTQSANQDQSNGQQQPANQQPQHHNDDQEEQQYLGLNHQDQGKKVYNCVVE